jgi:hypothetical protein
MAQFFGVPGRIVLLTFLCFLAYTAGQDCSRRAAHFKKREQFVAKVSSWSNMREVVRESIGLIGFWMTLRYLLIYFLSYKPFKDDSFDRRHGTDTAGMVPTADLDIDDESTKWQSNLYLGSPARVTRHLIRSLAIDPADYTFIDYGSGKGRVLFAAAEFPFRQVVGVEISQALHAVAEKNLTQARERYRDMVWQRARIPAARGQSRASSLPSVRAGCAEANAGRDRSGQAR